MSNLQDIHKLRQARNMQPYYSTTQRFSQPNQPQPYRISIDRLMDHTTNPTNPTHPTNPTPLKFYDTYTKYVHSKETPPTTERKLHRRGQSNASSYAERRELESGSSSALSMYPQHVPSYTMTIRPAQKSTYVANPLTARRERVDETDFELMPQTESREDRRNQQKISLAKPQRVHKGHFNILYPIGKGGFGKVWKVQHKKTGQILAMKQMYKAKIIQKKSINSVMNQRNLLSKLKHPFIINITKAFQDRENLYLVMQYIDGGDLRYHIGKKRKFNQKQSKFFISNIIVGLEYLHRNRIIHRDIKPENLVFDSEGYLRITDLGISREFREDNHQDTSGTPGYMSPEVICRKNHSFSVDYFAVGVMGYEFMLGKRPYIGRNRKQIRDQILSKQACIKPEQLPPNWSAQSADFINKLLTRNPSHRLGSTSIQQLKSHPWLSTIDWKKLYKKQIPAPYIPLSIQQNYEDYKEQISQDSVDQNMEENLLMLRKKEVQDLFQEYYFQRVGVQDVKKRLSYTTVASSTSHPSSLVEWRE